MGAGAWAQARLPTRSRPTAANSVTVLGRVVEAGRVVGRFLRNGDVMWMTLLHRRRAYLDEAGASAQFLDVSGAAVPHAGPQPAHQLVDERSQRTLVGHSSLDSLGHQFVPLPVLLAVAVPGAGHQGTQGAHPAVYLEGASLVDDGLP